MDPVSAYLTSKGLSPQIEYMGDSDYVLGHRIETRGMSLVYRLEDDHSLIICDFDVNTATGGQVRPLKTFLKLMRAIIADVPEVNCVRGLMIPLLTDPEHNARLARLAGVLLEQGAGLKKYDRDTWLVFPAPSAEIPPASAATDAGSPAEGKQASAAS